jgi:hypothetical protein
MAQRRAEKHKRVKIALNSKRFTAVSDYSENKDLRRVP